MLGHRQLPTSHPGPKYDKDIFDDSWTGSASNHYSERECVSNHRRLDCLLKRWFGRWSKKTSMLPVTGFCEGNPPVIGGFPHKWPVTTKMFPFDDVIMIEIHIVECYQSNLYCQTKIFSILLNQRKYDRPTRIFHVHLLHKIFLTQDKQCIRLSYCPRRYNMSFCIYG